MGTTLANSLLKGGTKFASIKIAARNVEKTTAQLKEKRLEISVGPSKETLTEADVIILATPGIYDDAGIQEFAASLGDMKDKIILDAMNPLDEFDKGLNIRWGMTKSGGEVLAEALPTAKVYKVFNSVGVEHMANAKGKTMLIAGDPDEKARAVAEGVAAGVGFDPFYVGPIRYARNLEAMAELWIHMAVPPLGGRNTGRNWWFSLSGKP